jgi:HSP20 family protein
MSRTEAVRVRKPQSIAEDLARINERIMRRAYEIFQNRGSLASDLDNWLTAESETVWKPAIELTETQTEFVLTVAAPGIEPKDIQVETTAEDIVIQAESHHEHVEGEGAVHSCEFQCGSMFRTVHFPKRINPDGVKAEFKHGILKIHAPISEDQLARKIEISAA